MNARDTELASAIMMRFAERTGLTSDRPPKRYLWTDAFAVCNFLGLAGATSEARYQKLALDLVAQVHDTLGRHRSDDPRSGFISGLSEAEGEAHPTRGGLRIGKPLPERRPDEPPDQELEWERDGQYFHYLTRWMHALDETSRVTGDPRFNRWGRELAEAAFAGFTRDLGARPRLVWKMSIDLSRPLVSSMGHHDPLDGYVTYTQLTTTAEASELEDAIAVFARMIEGQDFTTADPLGIGGLAIDAYRVAELCRQGAPFREGMLDKLLAAAARGLDLYLQTGELEAAAERRLPFRELGLAIGLEAVERLDGRDLTAAARAKVEALRRHAPLAASITQFWLEHQSASTFEDHLDINEVMLATALAPEGLLALPERVR